MKNLNNQNNMTKLEEYIKKHLEDKILSIKDEKLYLLTDPQKELVNEKLTELFKVEKNGKCILLARGISKKKIEDKLLSKLNSNNNLYDGLFLVGEKAKMFLIKEDDMPHSLKSINSCDKDVAEMIFDRYAELTDNSKIPIEVSYFKNTANKKTFIEKVKKNTSFINYYLFGLHTINSNILVYFVSSTTSPDIAESKDKYNNDLIILFWLTEEAEKQSVNKAKLDSLKVKIIKKKLPVLENSAHEDELEYAIKGFILPHFIVGVVDLKKNEFVINPALLEDKQDWITKGFDIDNLSFIDFIETTKYKRFLSLYDGGFFETSID